MIKIKKKKFAPEKYAILLITAILSILLIISGIILKVHISENNNTKNFIYSYISKLENENYTITKTKNNILAKRENFNNEFNATIEYNKDENKLILKIPYASNFDLNNYDKIKYLLNSYRKKKPFDIETINSAVNKMISEHKVASKFIDLDGQEQDIALSKGYVVIKLSLNY